MKGIPTLLGLTLLAVPASVVHGASSTCDKDGDCVNDGKCQSTFDGALLGDHALDHADAISDFHCVCKTGFQGEDCSIVCPNQCLNRGVCVVNENWADEHGGLDHFDAAGATQYVCSCKTGFIGPTCATKTSNSGSSSNNNIKNDELVDASTSIDKPSSEEQPAAGGATNPSSSENVFPGTFESPSKQLGDKIRAILGGTLGGIVALAIIVVAVNRQGPRSESLSRHELSLQVDDTPDSPDHGTHELPQEGEETDFVEPDAEIT